MRLAAVCSERLGPIECRTAVRADVLLLRCPLGAGPGRGRLPGGGLGGGFRGSRSPSTGGSGGASSGTHCRDPFGSKGRGRFGLFRIVIVCARRLRSLASRRPPLVE